MFGLIFGVGAFLVLLTSMGLDYCSTRDAPTENVTVVSSSAPDTQDGSAAPDRCDPIHPACARRFPRRHHQPGLPAEFSIAQCPCGRRQSGDHPAVRRTGTSADDFASRSLRFRVQMDLHGSAFGGVACTVMLSMAVAWELGACDVRAAAEPPREQSPARQRADE